ncbi:Meiotic recombination protein rec14 [Cladophialophora carrionii]|uniref:Meiotic recombination protein rec14 n=1 Tax=Cladophialophora carrionii TaxID=86049 RepID=A0A1C1CSR1_9EURO|nr:Meiotic recombination protein rec14 [Cladophialophora carrionii]
MSKQYLAQHAIDDAHAADIFALAVTTTQILTGSGESSIKVHSTTEDDFPLVQVLNDAHKVGCHHIVTDRETGRNAVSVGFGGEVKVWKYDEGAWKDAGEIKVGPRKKAGEMWAVSLSFDGKFLAGTTHDGRVNVWDLNDTGSREKIREFETKGSFGMSIDMSPDGRFIASGHESGNIYLFSTATSRLLHSLPGLIKAVRAVKFSPGSKLLAAAGDARIISLYDPNSGEQVANLTGHAAWITSLDWSHTGQYILSGSLDGKVKVWDIERRVCVATHGESDKGLWAVMWLPKGETSVERAKAEKFVTVGSNKAISIYREATGG